MSDPATKKLLAALRATRELYAQEGILHQFLVDATTGGGGFRNGQVPSMEAPYWGRAAYAYGDAWLDWYESDLPKYEHRDGTAAKQTWSYLTAFYGEDAAEYADRVNNSVYLNLVEPVVELVNSFITEDEPTRTNLPDQLIGWMPKANALGNSLSDVAQDVLMRGQIVGWCFTITDLPSAQGTSLADSRPPFVSVYWPQQALDWRIDAEGRLVAIKVCARVFLPGASLLEPAVPVLQYTLWYPDRWERYTTTEADPNDPQAEPKLLSAETGPNPFGRVPVSIFRWRKPVSGDPIKGQPQILTVAQLARDLFNSQSERRHLHRQQAFGLLVVPGSEPGGSPDGTVEASPGNFVTESSETEGITRYVSPTGVPFEAYKTLADEAKSDIYDVAMLDRGLSRQAETAEARRLRFRRTNAMLRRGAQNLDAWEKDVLTLVGIGLNLAPALLDKIVVHRKEDYSVQSFTEVLESALKVNDLPMAPESLAAIVNAAMRAVLTDATEEDLRRLEKLNLAAIKKLKAQPPPAAPGASAPPLAPRKGKPPTPAAPEAQPAT